MSRSTLILSVAVWLTMAATADARPDERTRPPARPGSEVATEGCVGPFSLAELDLYKEMEGARERLLATEAAVGVREMLLSAREEEIAKRLEELQAIEARIEARLAEIGERETRVAEAEAAAARVAAAPEAEGAGIRRAAMSEGTRAALAAAGTSRRRQAAELAKMVKAMRPEAAAQLLGELPSGLSTEVLSQLPARQAGRILSVMDPSSAAGISVAYVYRDQAEARPGRVEEPSGAAPEAPEGGTP